MSVEFNNISNPATLKTERLDDASKVKLQKAVREFESLFINYLLKSMRNTINKENDEGGSYGDEMMTGMFDMELSKHLARNSSFGVGEMLYFNLTGEKLPKKVPRISMNQSDVQSKDNTIIRTKEKSELLSDKITTKKTVSERMKEFDKIIMNASESYKVDSSLIKAVIVSESSVNVNALSKKNAKGLMQLIDSTAADMGVTNVWNPEENIIGGVKYLKKLLNNYGNDTKLALAAYNAGPGNVDKYNGVPPFRETREYIDRVLNYVKYFNKTEGKDND